MGLMTGPRVRTLLHREVPIMRIAVLGLMLALPVAAAAQPVVPGQPLGQPGPGPSIVGPQDSDILRRSSRSLPGDAPVVPPPPVSQTQLPPRAAGAPSSGLGSLVQPDGRIVITRDLCNQVNVQYQPSPDVNYRPGVDVYGRPVAPADLPNTGNTYGGLGTTSSTDLLVRPQAGGLNNRGGVIGETYVGRVTVDAAGHVAINGQPINQDQSELRQLCARAGY